VMSAILIGWWITSGDDVPAPVVPVVDNIPAAEQRLARLRQLAGAVPGKQQVLQQVTEELKAREKGLIQADTAPQAQEQLVQILRKLGRAPSTQIDMRNSEIGPVRPYGEKYAEVLISMNFEARIEQLVNLLSDLTSQKEIIGVNDLRIAGANPKEKTMPVRLTVSALIRRELLPEKKGPGTI
jgi:hypothetical protein